MVKPENLKFFTDWDNHGLREIQAMKEAGIINETGYTRLKAEELEEFKKPQP